MRILLLQAPVASNTPHARLSPPLGLAYVAAALLAEGHDVELIDLNVTGFNPARVEVALDRVDPMLVGISAHTEAYPNALALASLVKARDARTAVVLGGPHASILPHDVLAEECVDYVAVGEGERTACELAAALERGDRAALPEVRGLGHKASGAAEVNAPREPLDAADIGLPARELLSLDLYEDAHNILVSRGGCPYRCPFCSASHIWGGRRRMRPVEHIVDEVRLVLDAYGPSHVFFVDDILTLNRRWLGELLDALAPFAGLLTWGCATRVDCVDEPLLRRMAETGCTGIQFGIESGAQEVLDSVKGIDKSTALAAVKASAANGIATSCSFMVPFPQDTAATLAETLDFMRTLRDAGGRLLISYTMPFPGTRFHDEADELGLRILSDDYSLYDAKHVLLETEHLTAAQIESAAAAMAEDLGMARTA
jgi:radical SAM superfamily enzyme YgiQ (UPF0313 family)